MARHCPAFWLAVALVTAILLAAGQHHALGQAAQVEDDPVQQRLAALEQEVAALRAAAGAGSGVVHAASWESRGESNRGANGCSRLTSCSAAKCKSSAGIHGGAALIFAKPHFKEAFQISALNTGTGQQTLIPFSYDYGATPEFWLGMERADGLGVRGRYWQFDQGGTGITRISDGQTFYTANATTIIFPATIIANDPGEILRSDDNLKTQIIDFEATMRTQIGRMEIVGGGGLRYAALKQSLSSTVLDAGSNVIGLLQWTRDYEGLGPAVSIDLRRPIGNSGLSVVGKVNAALLFGHKDLNRTVVGDVTTPSAAPFLNLENADEVVGMGEVALGLQWRRMLRRSELVIGGMYQGQLWAEAGAPTLGFLGFEGFGLTAELRR
jgi:hypothetical protein